MRRQVCEEKTGNEVHRSRLSSVQTVLFGKLVVAIGPSIKESLQAVAIVSQEVSSALKSLVEVSRSYHRMPVDHLSADSLCPGRHLA